MAVVDVLGCSCHGVGQDSYMDEVAVGFVGFGLGERDIHRSQRRLEYFLYMRTELNRTPRVNEDRCATEAVEGVGRKDGLDRLLGRMLVKRKGRSLYGRSLGMAVWQQTGENDSL